MSRRKLHRAAKSNGSVYLNPDFEEINQTLVKENKRNKKGKNVSIHLPPQVKTGSYGYGNTGAYGSTTTYETHIHKGKDVVFEAQGKQLFAGNGRGVDESSGHWDLIIDLASQLPYINPYGCVKERSAKRFDILRKHTWGPKPVNSEVLSLDWPDMGIIPATLDFWITLWGMLPAKTVAMCIGGHGRTGTCLTALMIVAGENYYDALDHIRDKHCKKAVESVAQTKYLHAVYMERLKRQIKHEKDPQRVLDLQGELAYAEEHVPNNYSDYGDKEPPKPAKVVEYTTSSKSSNNEALAGDRLKMIAGTLYEQVCVDQSCKMSPSDCLDPVHQGWIEYDVEAEVARATK
jgi:hypothetical protein